MPLTLRTDVRGGSRTAAARGTVRTTVVSLLLALLGTFLTPLVAAPAANAAATPAEFAGISDWGWPSDAESAQLATDQVRTVRANLAWDWVEHQQGVRRWGGVDGLMKNAGKDGYDLLMVLNGCVAWSCGQTRVAPQTDAQRAQFLDFVTDAVRRYGAGGSYWAAHPELKPARVSWQVWNEVNVGADWPNPTASGYAALLDVTSKAIKGVDPSARVVTSGMAELPAVSTGQTMARFLTALEQDPTFRSSADVVALHGYAEDAAGTARILDTARQIMLAAGDTRPVWITELGWADGGPAHAFVRDSAGQAEELRRAYDLMVGCAARWNLQRAYWFGLSDIAAANLGEPDYWGMHTGLYTQSGAAKPALDAFREYLGGKELPAGRGGACALPGGAATDAPATTVKTPVVSVVKVPEFVGQNGRAVVDFVTDMGNSGHAECSLNGGDWQLCQTPYSIPRDQGEGQFTLRIRAIDRNGRMSAAPAVASWTTDLTAPRTVFTKRPPKRVRGGRAVTVRVGIAGQQGTRLGTGGERVSFQCQLNRAQWKPCQASQRMRARRAGKQVLRIRAVDAAGNVDPLGAQARYTVVR